MVEEVLDKSLSIYTNVYTNTIADNDTRLVRKCQDPNHHPT